MREFDSGNYQTAIELFENLPSDYKDVSHMVMESKYWCAMQYLNARDFTSAESLFESISSYKDSLQRINECRYQAACALYESENYTAAKESFRELGSYSDAKKMTMECDYSIAMEHKKNKEYVEAMQVFNDLDAYEDSEKQFRECEEKLISYNLANGYYTDEFSMLGEWTDGSGKYVTYEINGDALVSASLSASYNLAYTEGQVFKVTNGVHYHGDGGNSWEKQWIYQRINDSSAYVYDYIDGQIYELVKR